MLNPVPWTIRDIMEATKGVLLSGSLESVYTGISIDSRKISGEECFVALKGKNHDGHGFIPAIIDHGVKGLVIDKNNINKQPVADWKEKRISCVAVDDPVKALGDLAAYQRKRTKVSVAAVTGSNGKTTTREMTSAVINSTFDTLSTSGNFNNEIGLPLTLLKLTDAHEWAVVELGMNKPGEIRRLSEICAPDVGIITNIGPAHLEGVGSIEGVMNAKGELLEGIRPGGTAVLNADDPRVVKLAARASTDVLFYGLSEKAAVTARSLSKNGAGQQMMLELPNERISITLNLPGDFMILNALAAAAAGYIAGISAAEIKTALESFRPVQGRMNVFDTKKGIHIIDDTYNANPGSMEAAIKTLQSMKGENRSFLVAGDMYELGSHAAAMHKMIGALSARSRITRVYASGNFAGDVAEGAITEGMDSSSIFIGTKEDVLADLKNRLQPGDWVLVKGSRAMGMESIVREIKD